MSMKEKFVEFLKENDAYEKYNYNLLKECNTYFYDLFDEGDYGIFISGAFIWRDTPEGPHFWEEINNKWEEYYEKSL